MKNFLSLLLLVSISIMLLTSCTDWQTNTETGTNTNINSNTSQQTNYSSLFVNCPISIRVSYYTSDQTLSITATNNGDKTISAIKYLIVVYDVYGNTLNQYGYGSFALTATYDKFNIYSEKSATGDWRLNGFSDGKSLDIYIYSVYYSDNTEWGSRELSTANIIKYAPKIHTEGRYA